VRARPGRLSVIRVIHSASVSCGGLLHIWACRALNRPRTAVSGPGRRTPRAPSR
jgi:hypothetical protein